MTTGFNEPPKLLLGGSPCTRWSIAQTKYRETEPSGAVWELFLNFRIARDRFRPDFFLYENNKSMSAMIRAHISKELGVEPVLINSALVSAQNRQRLYWAGKRGPDGTYRQVYVEQPEDRGILLRDILEYGAGIGAKTGLYAAPVEIDGFVPGEATDVSNLNFLGGITRNHKKWLDNGKNYSRNFGQGYRLYGVDGKAATQTAQGCGVTGNTGLYAVPAGIAWRGRGGGSSLEVRNDEKANAVTAGGHQSRLVVEAAGGKTYPVYEVRNGLITIKGKQYPIKLANGWYIVRKLTVRECMRLQTVPEDFIFPVSDTQAYKMLGNGWTVDVIAHILSRFDGIMGRPLDVLSMYDGMSCGHLALDRLGANVARYHATEIDQYAIKTTRANYPATVQLGDAFQVRDPRWDAGGLFSEQSSAHRALIPAPITLFEKGCVLYG